VLLADDHAATTQLWRALLEPEFEVVGTVSDGRALVDAAERLAPDVIVTDIVMPGINRDPGGRGDPATPSGGAHRVRDGPCGPLDARKRAGGRRVRLTC
jgi:hypothetical protein